jgi:peptide chain release factor 2
LRRKLAELRTTVEATSTATVDLEGVRSLLAACEAQASRADFWDGGSEDAQRTLRELEAHKALLRRVNGWAASLADCEAALDMLREEADPAGGETVLSSRGGGSGGGNVGGADDGDGAGLAAEAAQALSEVEDDVARFRVQRLLSGEFDRHDSRVVVTAGAGGLEAQDWAEMLQRMYLRWAERQGPGYSARTVELSPGDDGRGVRQCEIEVRGEHAYGLLKGEKGTHRLVRISPFNAQGKRQTSFAAVETLPILSDDEIDALSSSSSSSASSSSSSSSSSSVSSSVDFDKELPESDLQISFMRSGGAGGQNVNKVESGVLLKHLPTGIQVKCTQERSQLQNRAIALKMLKEKLLVVRREQNVATLKEIRGDAVDANFGQQIRNYVLYPYKMVKDVRTQHETAAVKDVLDGDLDGFMAAYLRFARDEEQKRQQDQEQRQGHLV